MSLTMCSLNLCVLWGSVDCNNEHSCVLYLADCIALTQVSICYSDYLQELRQNIEGEISETDKVSGSVSNEGSGSGSEQDEAIHSQQEDISQTLSSTTSE